MYKREPMIRAKKPFIHPLLKMGDAIIFASWSHENTANIIPNAEINSQISFFRFIIYITDKKDIPPQELV